MKLYAHFDEREPAHTEVLEFDGSSDIPFELVRALFVDAYNAKHAPARLDPQALQPTDELGVARHPLGGSIFDALNEGDDLFFASGAGGTVASLKEEIQAGGAAPQPLAEQIAELKEQIKRATDEGQYDLLAPLAQQIKALEEEQQAKAAVPLPAPAVAPANPIEASRAAAGEHSHYYWDKQAKGAPEPKATPVRAPTTATKIERIRPIHKFALSDEGRWVRLYITHDGVGALPAGSTCCDFRERSFDLRITGAPTEEGAQYTHRLHAPVLAECVDPSRCKLRVKPSQVVVSLRKLDEGHQWQELHKIKGIGETGTIQPDYGDTNTLTV